MTEIKTPSAVSTAPAAIDASGRLPLLTLFLGAAFWLLVASVFGLISSIKFHGPNFLADSAWLTYGRVRPVYFNALLYGFCIPAGLGVALWVIARLGRCEMAHGWLAFAGAKVWNLGVAVGVLGILTGNSTGFENLEFPVPAAVLLLLGYMLVGLSAAYTFHRRQNAPLYPSQWFILAGLFWFPWVYTTATLLLGVFPVRGMTQAVIAWWFSGNLLVVWLWLMGLGAAFYFLPKLLHRDLNNGNLALFVFWTVLLFGAWAGIPSSASVPAWLPVSSLVMTVLLALPVTAAALVVRHTWSPVGEAPAYPQLSFIRFGLLAFLLAGVAVVASAFLPVSQIVNFTWFTPAQAHLNAYGFYAFVMFGAIYYITPRLFGATRLSSRLVKSHFWLAACGTTLLVLPLVAGGVLQGIKLQDPNAPFVEISRFTLHFLRLSTIGDLLIAAGHLLLFFNVTGLALKFYRGRARSAYVDATADLLQATEAKA